MADRFSAADASAGAAAATNATRRRDVQLELAAGL